MSRPTFSDQSFSCNAMERADKIWRDRMNATSPISAGTRPLRIAIVGAGPAGIYAADALMKSDAEVSIDL
ncbi:hypothetical protein, partial [Nocardia sp. NPDC050175]|uniref:hypothetical protein n=1 Tax=Nocardia sp. NPDC050175 TaxID=3364317 RepID=UPI003788A33E